MCVCCVAHKVCAHVFFLLSLLVLKFAQHGLWALPVAWATRILGTITILLWTEFLWSCLFDVPSNAIFWMYCYRFWYLGFFPVVFCVMGWSVSTGFEAVELQCIDKFMSMYVLMFFLCWGDLFSFWETITILGSSSQATLTVILNVVVRVLSVFRRHNCPW